MKVWLCAVLLMVAFVPARAQVPADNIPPPPPADNVTPTPPADDVPPAPPPDMDRAPAPPDMDQAPAPPDMDQAPAPPDTDQAPAPPAREEAPAPPRESHPKAQELSPPDAWLPRRGGTLRVMNKIDSTVQTLSVPVGGSVTYQSLTIKMSGCFVRPPDLPADAAAHLTITDSRPDQPGFDAWMLQKEPALNMLEHPVYDVQLVGCA